MMFMSWNDDHELFDAARAELYTAVVGDIMDQMGLLHQFLPARIRPLREEMVVIGRAMTVLEMDVPSGWPGSDAAGHGADDTSRRDRPFGLMLQALDDLKPCEVYLCSGASPCYALWGELMSTRARKLGAAGAVVNGYHRDTRGILALGFPTFSHGAYAQDQAPRGRIVDFRCPLEIEGVCVHSGDIVFGDLDGVCIVPRHIEREVFCRSLVKARGEKTVGKALEQGLSASEAFARYGIL
jgi:regulator of RNase E activity RraA